MKRILLIQASPRGEASYSYQAARAFVDRLRSLHPDAALTVRDLAKDPPPHVGEAFVRASALPTTSVGPEDALALRGSDELIEELTRTDVIVLAVPMHNFGPPSSLKAWIDQVVRAGRTFGYSSDGPRGLLEGKTAVLVLATGGVYSDGPTKPLDFVDPYLRSVLGFIGITNVETIRVEGVAMSAVGPDKALASAAEQSEVVLQRLAPSRLGLTA